MVEFPHAIKDKEMHSTHGSSLRDLILGGQDGLVNVLGLILGVASATNNSKLVVISGLAATFAESISMAAVAYTSTKASRDFYYSELQREIDEMEHKPDIERQEIRDIYYEKGFRGEELEHIVSIITSDKKMWLDIMMQEELKLFKSDLEDPIKSAVIVGFSAIIGSIIPIIPFFLFTVSDGILWSLIISVALLFIAGAFKAKLTIGSWIKNGIEMAIVGITAAIAGYIIGKILGVTL